MKEKELLKEIELIKERNKTVVWVITTFSCLPL